MIALDACIYVGVSVTEDDLVGVTFLAKKDGDEPAQARSWALERNERTELIIDGRGEILIRRVSKED